MKNKILIFILVSNSALASPFGFQKGRWTTLLEGSYFYSKSNFSSNGNIYSLPTDNQFSEYRGLLGGSFDILDFLGVYSNVSFKRVNSLGLPLERSNTGFSEWTGGVDAEVYSGFVKLVPDLAVTFPLHGSHPTDSALLDDGAMKVTALLHTSRQWFAKFWTVLNLGYQYVSEDLSDNFIYGFQVQHHLGDFYYSLGVNGQESLKSDGTSDGVRYTTVGNLNAGSFKYRYYNTSYSSALIKVGYTFSSSIESYIAAEIPVYGQNAAHGYRGLIGFIYTYNPPEALKKPDPFTPEGSDTFVPASSKKKSKSP